ncbi:type 1 glutamine amidotransferase domain-containing protein [Kitasatospora sp. NPDC057904]|uniref:type 1 glutamine amidotransferase domain-containing protein n=1 Tax=unclassified Kitasatospora TaxID=2633591 RepID=UPI0036DB2744
MNQHTKVLAIVTDYGVEQDELLVPVRHLRGDGVHVDIAAPSRDGIRTLVRDKEPGETVSPTHTLGEVDATGYDLLLIPGGTLNADHLRMRQEAVDLVLAFTTSGRPVAAICHGPWLLAEAGVVYGKEITSFPSLRTDLANAGATWTDAALVTDDTNGWRLVTSRKPEDLEQFLRGIDAALKVRAATVGQH